MSNQRRIRVLVVDDSAVVRRMISEALGRDPEIEVVGAACDPYVARDMILQLEPDVLTLDIEMPRMDGLTFLKILQQHRPMPVIIVSSLTPAGSKMALRALELGAVDVVAKQSSAWNIGGLRDQLAYRVKGAARARLSLLQPQPSAAAESSAGILFSPRQLIVIGASTGGTEAVKSVLMRLPAGLPGICIVQHIPPVFSRTFAERLDECCALEVREAAHGDEVLPGTALIAPGDYHMAVEWTGNRYRIRLRQDPPIHFTRPAVDMLFNSAAHCAGRHALGVLLTGMGRDGAQGMQQLKAAGATNLVQNEATCVVYGMPRAAVELGVVDRVLPLDHMPHAIIHALRERAPRPAAAQPK
ncbi:MAG TPA: chemotaxis response regulator protein-glutamate methylesterase [Candidatus Acidoferrales bacterium]|nr:chemotaxis response regulator protein-glutamate methylesterase [Candidatus Acidoferrales bacterium]